MKTYVQDGDTITLVAPYAVAAGGGALVGSIFGVALMALASGASGQFRRRGVMDIAKTTGEAWTIGQLLYWDNTGKKLTTTVGSNKAVGAAAAAQASGDTTGRALITGQVS